LTRPEKSDLCAASPMFPEPARNCLDAPSDARFYERIQLHHLHQKSRIDRRLRERVPVAVVLIRANRLLDTHRFARGNQRHQRFIAMGTG